MTSVPSLLRSLFTSSCVWPNAAEDHSLGCERFVTCESAAENAYLDVELNQTWSSEDISLCGDRSHRADCVNGMHVFYMENRVCVVWAGRHVFLPFLEGSICDVYADEIDDDVAFIVVASTHELSAAAIKFSEAGTTVLASVSVKLSTPPSRLHQCGPMHLALCYVNGRVDLMEVVTCLESSSPPMIGLQLASRRERWSDKLSGFFSTRRYIDSCINADREYLTILTNEDLTLLHIDPSCTDIRPIGTLKWTNNAVAVVACSGTCLTGRRVCRVIFHDGSSVIVFQPLSTHCGTGSVVARGTTSPTVSIHTLCTSERNKLPVRTPVHHIDCLCHASDTTLMYDRHAQTLTILCENVHLSARSGFRCATVVSQMYVNMDNVRGIGFGEEVCGDSSTVFWIYGDGCILFMLRRLSDGRLLRFMLSNYVDSGSNRWNDFYRIPVNEQADLLWAAVFDGLAYNIATPYIRWLKVPTMIDPYTMQLSPAVIAMTSHIMRDVVSIERLCNMSRSIKVKRKMRSLLALLQGKCDAAVRVLGDHECIGDVETPQVTWTHSLQGVSSDTLTTQTSSAVQSQFVDDIVNIIRKVELTVSLFCMLLEANVDEPGFSILNNLNPTNLDCLMLKFCKQLLSLNDARIVEALSASDVHDNLSLPARLAVRVRQLCSSSQIAAALDLVCKHILQVREHDLFAYFADLLEREDSALMAQLQMAKECSHKDELSVPDVIALLAQIPPEDDDRTYRSLRCILEDARVEHLRAAVLLWIANHSIHNQRLTAFARAVNDSGVTFDHTDGLAGQFISYWCKYHRGASLDAARHFGELARTSTSMPIGRRLVCASLATQRKPTIMDTLTRFTLMLQQQLLNMLQLYAKSGEFKNYSRQLVEDDINILSTHFLSDDQLFDIAGRYRELGGASIQLDVLKVHTDASQATTEETLMAMLNFLHVSGLSALDAARRVLYEYVAVFATPLPLLPFIEFLRMEKCTVQSVLDVLMSSGVTPLSVLGTVLDLLGSADYALYSENELADAMVTQVVNMDDADQRRVCAAYLLEHIHVLKASDSAYGIEYYMNKSVVENAERQLIAILS